MHFLSLSRCGSGLSGEALTEQGHHWVGMDISSSMLGRCNNLKGDQPTPQNIILYGIYSTNISKIKHWALSRIVFKKGIQSEIRIFSLLNLISDPGSSLNELVEYGHFMILSDFALLFCCDGLSFL